MRSDISEETRRLVAERANSACEYCLIDEDDTYFGCEVDHIISLKHGGATIPDNLAYACFFCNRRKGSDIASIMPDSRELVRFYNPRTDRWTDHFRLRGAVLAPLTNIGVVTAHILGFNEPDRLEEREQLQAMNRYPLRVPQ